MKNLAIWFTFLIAGGLAGIFAYRTGIKHAEPVPVVVSKPTPTLFVGYSRSSEKVGFTPQLGGWPPNIDVRISLMFEPRVPHGADNSSWTPGSRELGVVTTDGEGFFILPGIPVPIASPEFTFDLLCHPSDPQAPVPAFVARADSKGISKVAQMPADIWYKAC